MQHHQDHDHVLTLSEKIEKLTSESPVLCYQCGKCSAGCPIRDYMEDSPNQVVRLVQLGFDEEALKSKTIWLCASCLTCSSRCPQNFDIARFMDAMRETALREGVEISEKDTVKFHEAFLNQIRRNGKTFELGLTLEYKLKTQDLFQDVDVAPEMFLKGKINLFPHKIKNGEEMKKIFDQTE